MFTLPAKIAAHLNNGHMVAAEVSAASAGTRCFVRIRPVVKAQVEPEGRRYLNSPLDMWEYWDFAFRRIVLTVGWEADEWNYDRYIVEDQGETATNRARFTVLADRWIPDVNTLKLADETDLPE